MNYIPKRDHLSDEEIKDILNNYRKVAVVGISRDRSKPSHYVPKFLILKKYEVFPVNPYVDEILGLSSYKDLTEIQDSIDIVDVFRPPEQIPSIVQQALEIRPKIFWMQEGIRSPEAVHMLEKTNIKVIWDRCMMKEHNRLFGSKPLIPLGKI